MSTPEKDNARKSTDWLWRAWTKMCWLTFPLSVLVKFSISAGWEFLLLIYFGLLIWAVLALASWAPKKILAKRGFDTVPAGVGTAFLLHHSLVFLTIFCLPTTTDVDQYASPLTVLFGSSDAIGRLRDFNENLFVAAGVGALLSLSALWVLGQSANPSQGTRKRLSPVVIAGALLAVLVVGVGLFTSAVAPEDEKDALGRTNLEVRRQGEAKLLEFNRQQWEEQQEQVATLRGAIHPEEWFIEPRTAVQEHRSLYNDRYEKGNQLKYVLVSQWSTASTMDPEEARVTLESALGEIGYRALEDQDSEMRFFGTEEDYASYQNSYVAIWEPREWTSGPQDSGPHIRVTVLPNEGSNRQDFPEAASIVRIQAESGALFGGGRSFYDEPFQPRRAGSDDENWQHPADRTYQASQWPSFDEAAQWYRGYPDFEPPICWEEECPVPADR